MSLRDLIKNERTITIVGSIAFGSSGLYSFLLAGITRFLFDLEENFSMIFIGAPAFLIFFFLHIFVLPKHLRKAGLIE